jgi:2,3-diketo-5-methylthio-1-phosphopentane phosphatase
VKCHVFVDFDGTIVPQDATDRILEAYADPSWLEIEADWKAGRIGSRECLSRQVAMIRATPKQLDDLIATFEVDPGFPAFVQFCRDQGFGISVLSDGLDRAVRGVLSHSGVVLTYAANRLAYLGDERWELGFPHEKAACTSAAGNCKCAAAMATGAPATIMVGDGRSDFCISNRATFVLAKSSLVAHCEVNKLPHKPFKTFAEAPALIVDWLEQQARASSIEQSTISRFGRRVAGR